MSTTARESHHSKFAQSGAAVRAIGHGLAADAHGKVPQSGIVTAVGDVGSSLLKVPAAIVGAAVPN